MTSASRLGTSTQTFNQSIQLTRQIAPSVPPAISDTR